MIPWLRCAYAWSGWDWVRWGAPYLALGLTLGAITDIAVRVLL